MSVRDDPWRGFVVVFLVGLAAALSPPAGVDEVAGGQGSAAGSAGSGIAQPGVLDHRGAGIAAVARPAAAEMTEGFEGAWPGPGWVLQDLGASDGGEYLWGKRNCVPHAGEGAGWAIGGGSSGSALACGASYPNRLNTWATYGPFSLADASSAALTFYFRGRTEGDVEEQCPFDYLLVGSSSDDDVYAGTRYCGDWTDGTETGGYFAGQLDLGDRLGQDRVWIAFALRSDDRTAYSGITVDDVVLDVVRSGVPTITPAATLPVEETPTPSPRRHVYLPVVLRTWPPVPEPPDLLPIENADGDGSYTVRWSEPPRAETYALQEARSDTFAQPTVRYTGFGRTWNARDQSPGVYYYRVRSSNGWGDGGWSDVQVVSVGRRLAGSAP